MGASVGRKLLLACKQRQRLQKWQFYSNPDFGQSLVTYKLCPLCIKMWTFSFSIVLELSIARTDFI